MHVSHGMPVSHVTINAIPSHPLHHLSGIYATVYVTIDDVVRPIISISEYHYDNPRYLNPECLLPCQVHFLMGFTHCIIIRVDVGGVSAAL